MKKLLLIVATWFAISLPALAQLSTAQYANSSTGTTLNTLTKIVVNATVPQAQIAATTDTQGVIGITTDGAGTTGKPTITYSGIAPCVFSNTVVANDFVQISPGTAGDCFDAGLSRPTSGQIIGVVAQTGGAAGTYNVLLDKSILPSSSSTTTTLCNLTPAGDTLTQAGATLPGTFATTCSVSGLVVGSFLEIRARGVYSATATTAPTQSFQVNAGGTTGVCSHTGTIAPGVSVANGSWEISCYIHILTTGAPGTATVSGLDVVGTSNSSGSFSSKTYPQGGTSVSFTTNTAQTISIQSIATPVAGQSFTLQDLIVRNITAN